MRSFFSGLGSPSEYKRYNCKGSRPIARLGIGCYNHASSTGVKHETREFRDSTRRSVGARIGHELLQNSISCILSTHRVQRRKPRYDTPLAFGGEDEVFFLFDPVTANGQVETVPSISIIQQSVRSSKPCLSHCQQKEPPKFPGEWLVIGPRSRLNGAMQPEISALAEKDDGSGVTNLPTPGEHGRIEVV